VTCPPQLNPLSVKNAFLSPGLPTLQPCGLVSIIGVISQNHRMFEAEMDLWKSSGPTPHTQAGPPKAGCSRTMSRRLLNISREGDSATSLGNLCQCSVTLTVKKNCFLVFRWTLLCFSLCPLSKFLLE